MSQIETLRTEISNALTKQKFPIRGWDLSISYSAAPDRHVFELLPQEPKLSVLDGTVTAKPDPIDEVLATEVLAFAVFGVPKSLEIPVCGKPMHFNPQCLDSQYVTIYQPERDWDIHIDFRVAAAYEARTLMPDPPAFRGKVEKWAEIYKRNKDGKGPDAEFIKARYVLAQLRAFQVNALSTMRTLMQKMVQTVKQAEPDYFALIERLMTGKMTVDEIHAAARSRGKQVIVVLPHIPGDPTADKPRLM